MALGMGLFLGAAAAEGGAAAAGDSSIVAVIVVQFLCTRVYVDSGQNIYSARAKCNVITT